MFFFFPSFAVHLPASCIVHWWDTLWTVAFGSSGLPGAGTLALLRQAGSLAWDLDVGVVDGGGLKSNIDSNLVAQTGSGYGATTDHSFRCLSGIFGPEAGVAVRWVCGCILRFLQHRP